ncbi:hypothetical protein E3P91_04199, partial [Wallemia ichthyophaga]
MTAHHSIAKCVGSDKSSHTKYTRPVVRAAGPPTKAPRTAVPLTRSRSQQDSDKSHLPATASFSGAPQSQSKLSYRSTATAATAATPTAPPPTTAPPTTPGQTDAFSSGSSPQYQSSLGRHSTTLPSTHSSPSPLSSVAPKRDLQDEFIGITSSCSVVKPLHPAWGAAFRDCVNRLTTEFVNNPTELNLFHLFCLPKGGLAPALREAKGGRQQASRLLSQYPFIDLHPVQVTPPSEGRSVVKAVEGYVEQGRPGTASNILGGTSSIHELTEDVVNTLQAKHPAGQHNPFGKRVGYLPGSMPLESECFEAFKKMNPGTSAGPSGWTHALTKEAFKVPQFNTFINLLCRMVIQGTAPGRYMICASRLIPLAKPDGGVRPIAVGEVFYRIIMKTLMRTYYKESALLPCQLGVGSSGGVEPIVLAAQRQVDKPCTDFKFLISLDFSNAFNSIKRSTLGKAIHRNLPSLFKAIKWAYDAPTPLIVNDSKSTVTVESSEGVKQGDPMGPLLFSLAAKETLQQLQRQLEGRATLMAYLDDIFLFAKEDVMDEVEDFFKNVTCGLQLNRKKCSVVAWEDIRRDGYGMLGSAVGSREPRVHFLRNKVSSVVEKLDSMKGIKYQHQLLLLHRCVQMELRHLQRTLRTDDMLSEWAPLDIALHNKVKDLRGSPRVQGLDGWVIGMPIRHGGMGIPAHSCLAPIAYRCMEDMADRTLVPIFNPEDVVDEQPLALQRQKAEEFYESEIGKVVPTLSRDQQNVLMDSSSKFGRKWITTFPYNRSLTLSDTEVSYALHIRTLCPGSSPRCIKCGGENGLGHDDLCQQRENVRLGRHEYIKKVLVKALTTAPN